MIKIHIKKWITPNGEREPTEEEMRGEKQKLERFLLGPRQGYILIGHIHIVGHALHITTLRKKYPDHEDMIMPQQLEIIKTNLYNYYNSFPNLRFSIL